MSRRSLLRRSLGTLAVAAAGVPLAAACSTGTSVATAPVAATSGGTTGAVPVVATRTGKVRGALVDGVRAFQGIPYAAPPTGPDRFQLPRPVRAWEGVRDALEPGATQFQPAAPPLVDALTPTFPGIEVLNLSVWTPQGTPAGLPVIVRIASGTETGSAAAYDGSRFARDGVVFVAVNFRLGPDGFLLLDGVPANLGLLDQVAALHWVRDNIAGFGGDPGNVTVCGESGAALMTMERARGLFRRVIMESAAGHRALPVEAARAVTDAFTRILGVTAHADAVAFAPLDRILDAQTLVTSVLGAHPDPRTWSGEPGRRVAAWQPVIDEDILPARPVDRIAIGAGADVDVLIGTNVDEARVALVPAGTLATVTEETLTAAATAYGLTPAALAAYRGTRPFARPGDVLAALQTDWYQRVPALALAETRTSGPSPATGRTFMYEFAWPSPLYGGRLGAAGMVELPFVLDRLDATDYQQLLTGPAAPQPLATAMHGAWVAFATAGDPGWPRYEPQRRATMRFDAASAVVEDPRAFEREFWANLR